MTPNPTMAGKPVLFSKAPVFNMKSGFADKGLCDGISFTAGTSCVYSCEFCFVESMVSQSGDVQKALADTGKKFHEIVIRRENVLQRMESSLKDAKGKPRFMDGPKQTVYASPMVDIAPNIELAKETLACVQLILKYTNWDIRLLSKSNLLPLIANGIDPADRQRLILGVSTGTFNDKLTQAFERGTPLVSKRLESLYWLQDHGFRTFGMLCPIIPQEDADGFAQEAYAKLRAQFCEHVWAEVLNVRGESMTRTQQALLANNFPAEAARIADIQNPQKWEAYARSTYSALIKVFPDKLQYLQYVNPSNRAWWAAQKGVRLLGAYK